MQSFCKACKVGRRGAQSGLIQNFHETDFSIGCVNCTAGKHQDIAGQSTCKIVGEENTLTKQGSKF